MELNSNEIQKIIPHRYPFLLTALVLALNGVDAADARGDIHAETGRIDVLIDDAAVLIGLNRRHHRILGEQVHPPGLPFIDIPGDIQVFDLTGQLDLVRRGVKMGDGADAAPAIPGGLPHLLGGVADGADGAHTGDHNSSLHSLSFRSFSCPRHIAMPPSTLST